MDVSSSDMSVREKRYRPAFLRERHCIVLSNAGLQQACALQKAGILYVVDTWYPKLDLIRIPNRFSLDLPTWYQSFRPK